MAFCHRVTPSLPGQHVSRVLQTSPSPLAMPELPEVETIVRGLRPLLIGKTIRSAEVLWERALAMPSPSVFAQAICGRRIAAVSRRAKFIHVLLSPSPTLSLLVHLRMSGDLHLEAENYQASPHDRLLLYLSEGKTLVFRDPRKFGRVWLVDDSDAVFGHLGLEPLSYEFTSYWLHEALHRHHRPLKSLLLDQTFLAGLGNIYADEALHRSRLHPLRLSDTISKEEAQRLHAAIQQVLQEGIAHNGASIDWAYRGGGFQNHLRVYGRTGLPCPTCGTPIERLVVNQRSAHVCPSCQPRN